MKSTQILCYFHSFGKRSQQFIILIPYFRKKFPPFNSFPPFSSFRGNYSNHEVKIAIMRKLYESFPIFHFQKRIVFAETICGNTLLRLCIWCRIQTVYICSYLRLKRQGCKKCYVAIKEKSKKKEFSIFGIDDNGEILGFSSNNSLDLNLDIILFEETNFLKVIFYAITLIICSPFIFNYLTWFDYSNTYTFLILMFTITNFLLD